MEESKGMGTTMLVTPANNNGGDGLFGGGNNGNGWWIILLFILLGYGRNGFGGGYDWQRSSVQDNYVLSSDFAMIDRKLDGITNGLCDGFYTQAQLVNGVNTNVMQTGYAITNAINGIGTQMAQCCCDIREGIAGVNYNMAMNTNGLSREVERGFCDTQYRDAMNTNNLMQSGHADADRIIAKLDAMENARKDETIARQNQEIMQWQNRAVNEAQTATLLRELGYQCPKPAYVVQPPQQVTFATNCCGQTNFAGNGGCGCGTF